MRIRLHGTEAEIAAALTALTKIFNIRYISRRHPDRAPSTLERIYLDAAPRASKEARQ
ncbi:DUF3970 family protein [Polymorphospora sp. NPDC051019]|uniref:DUF3970 family protein n=1 Tax=Polymorphospora sp. NPDC051019 TaxID=3155725 RepID=UPI0034144058